MRTKTYNVLAMLDYRGGYFILGLLKHLKEIMDCKFYAIAGRERADYEFWKNQDILKFEKIWYYPEYYNNRNDLPDIQFLQDFEKKIGENLWMFAYLDRTYQHRYNEYHKFSENEILSILEKTCRLYLSAFEEVKPDFIISSLPDFVYDALFIKLAEKFGIRKYLFSHTRFLNYSVISDDIGGNEFIIKQKQDHDNCSTIIKEDLLDLRKQLCYQTKTKKIVSDDFKRLTLIANIRFFLKFLLTPNDKAFLEIYHNYGRTKPRIIINKFREFIRRGQNVKFLNKTAYKFLPRNEKFVYFPLHVEPESSTLVLAPFHSDQIAILQKVARSLPVDHWLYVKEHPGQNFGLRDLQFYKSIIDMPNVRLIHPSVSVDELLQKTSLVVTITGTSGLEALFFKKPVIVFTHIFYDEIKSVKKITDITQLPDTIKSLIEEHQFDESSFTKFLETLKLNAVETNYKELIYDIHSLFPKYRYGSEPVKKSDFDDILTRYRNDYVKLANFFKNRIESDLRE